MTASIVVFYKIVTTCLLIFVGFLARRMKILPENSTAFISKYMVTLALPAYLMYYMPASISPEMLSAYWYYPLLAAFLAAVLDLFGHAASRLWARPGEHATFRMLTAFSNWIFMALAVCEPVFGADGVRVVLLYNIGLMFYFWSFGMTGFRKAAGAGEILKKLFLNTQTIALLIGGAVALGMPWVRGMETLGAGRLAELPFLAGVFASVWSVVHLVGSTAMPLAILQIGMLLGAPRARAGAPAPGGAETRSLILTCILRLLAAPALILAVQAALFPWGILTGRAEFVTSVIIMAMPAATLCFTIAEVHGGASRLAARAVLWSTVASLLTAPAATWLAETVFQRLG